jgi:hypothetical protein
MIVERSGDDPWTGRPRVWCEWFDAANYRHNESFAPEVLEEARDTPSADSGSGPEASAFFGRS